MPNDPAVPDVEALLFTLESKRSPAMRRMEVEADCAAALRAQRAEIEFLSATTAAVDAGSCEHDGCRAQDLVGYREKAKQFVTRFHEMKAEIERLRADGGATEALAQFMLDHSFATGHGDTHADLLAELAWQVKELWKTADVPLPEAPEEIEGRVE